MRPASRLAACRLPTSAACILCSRPVLVSVVLTRDVQMHSTGTIQSAPPRFNMLQQPQVPSLEFVLLGEALKHTLAGAGSSQVESLPTASARRLLKPLLLVSDLDDTLVAHTTSAPGSDAASAAFKAMWESSKAAGIHCKLAINTGRCEAPVPSSSKQQRATIMISANHGMCMVSAAVAGPSLCLRLLGAPRLHCCPSLMC